jgi:hypothetical protein
MLAAAVTLPESMTARNASTCLRLIAAMRFPFITSSHEDNAIMHLTIKIRVGIVGHRRGSSAD